MTGAGMLSQGVHLHVGSLHVNVEKHLQRTAHCAIYELKMHKHVLTF